MKEAPILSRRDMLGRMSAGFGMVSLANLCHAANPALSRLPNAKGKAKRVIFLFMNGGPSHVDTFDPKPALARYAGQAPTGKLFKPKNTSGFLPSPLRFGRFGQSGMEISESLPRMSEIADDLCVIRSMHTDIPNHEPALLLMHTGHIQPTRPSLGSWAIYGLGQENENLPGYVVLRPSPKIVVGPALWSSGFLPAEFQATSVITADMAVDKLLKNSRSPSFNFSEQRAQLDLLAAMNHEHMRARQGVSELEAQIKAMETAYRMQMEAASVFDISRESEATRASYGDTRFGKSCLLARQLVENGVRFVTVYYTADSDNQPWDTHSNHYKRHGDLCADGDRASAALISDLKARGLLDDTLVIWSGEFGRTPYAERREGDKSSPGRDHHHTAFTTVLAGGGVKGGYVHGASDELGMVATVDPVHVHDLHATVLHLLGIDHEELTYRYAGRDFRLTDVYGKVVRELLA